MALKAPFFGESQPDKNPGHELSAVKPKPKPAPIPRPIACLLIIRNKMPTDGNAAVSLGASSVQTPGLSPFTIMARGGAGRLRCRGPPGDCENLQETRR
ncbi:hypothetical protein ACJZ2D_006691 [Fusarium nematophilum]